MLGCVLGLVGRDSCPWPGYNSYTLSHPRLLSLLCRPSFFILT
jgi:hypothetical protein